MYLVELTTSIVETVRDLVSNDKADRSKIKVVGSVLGEEGALQDAGRKLDAVFK